MLIGQPLPAVTCITQFSPRLLDSLLLQLPALHSFLRAYWTASSCCYLHYTVFSVLIGQPPPAVTCITQFSPFLLDSLLLQLVALHNFLFKEGTVIMEGEGHVMI